MEKFKNLLPILKNTTDYNIGQIEVTEDKESGQLIISGKHRTFNNTGMVVLIHSLGVQFSCYLKYDDATEKVVLIVY